MQIISSSKNSLFKKIIAIVAVQAFLLSQIGLAAPMHVENLRAAEMKERASAAGGTGQIEVELRQGNFKKAVLQTTTAAGTGTSLRPVIATAKGEWVEQQVTLHDAIRSLKQEEAAAFKESNMSRLGQTWSRLAESTSSWDSVMQRRKEHIDNLLCDLHVHSGKSDAPIDVTYAVLMELADETGVGTLSISDHNIQDWLEVLREAERLQREKGVVVDIVPGVELSLQVRNHIADFPGEIHLRLACVDVTNPNLQKIVEEVRLAHLAGIRAAADFFFSATDWQDLRDRIFAGLTTTLTDEDHQNIYETIIKNWQEKLSPEQREAIIKEGGRLDNFAEAILGTKEDHPYYRPIREFAKRFAGNQLNDAVEVLKQIRKIDPHASIILCHIWRYTKDEETAHKLVELLANEGLIDAMETDYSSFTADEKKAARRLADNHGLKYSGGSDSHRIDKEGETDGTLGSGYRDNIKIRTDEMVNWMRQKASEDYLRQ